MQNELKVKYPSLIHGLKSLVSSTHHPSTPRTSFNPASTLLYHLPLSSKSSPSPFSHSCFRVIASLAAAMAAPFCASSGFSSFSKRSRSLDFLGTVCWRSLSSWLSLSSSVCLDRSRSSVAGRGSDRDGFAAWMSCSALSVPIVSLRESIGAGNVASCVVCRETAS